MYEEKSSWSETIKEYEKSKKILPWNNNENIQIKKISLLERKEKEREVNPILMEYRDTNKEKEFKETLTLTLEKKYEDRRAKIPSRKYNIVTHSGQPKEKKEYDRVNRGTRDYNILSHFNNKFHEAAPLEYDEFFAKECSRKPIVRTKESFRTRDFNILSNKYHVDHEIKEANDNDKLNTILSEKYWKTHSYDPIKVQSYDIQNEEQYQKQAEKKIQNERKHQDDMFPKCVKYAEGNTYNILSQEITHYDRFKTVQDQTNNRSLNRYKTREVFQNTLQNTTMQLDSLNDERKINRISFQRWENQINRGYDPITNTKLQSNSLIPLSKRPMTVWDKLQTTSPANDIWENDPNVRLNRSSTAIGNKMDVSNNHGLNDDWDNDIHEKKNHKELHLSKSLSHLPSSEPNTERNGMFMKNSQSISNLNISSRDNNNSNNNNNKIQIPSLDLSRASTGSSSFVRTGGLGSFN